MSAAQSKKSCYFFLGPEIGEKQTALNELRKKITDADASGNNTASGSNASRGLNLEESVYYAGEAPVNQIVSALRNGALFADWRLFIVKNAEQIKKKEDIDLFTAYIKSPQDSTTLVFLSDENSIAKGFEKAGPQSVKQVFYELSDQRKNEWVRDFFRKEGFRVNEDGIMTILELVENNTDALRRECSALVLFLDRNSEIGPDEIEKWLSHTREESTFTLFTRIAAGDFPRSLESLRTLLAAKTDPPAIFASLFWCFKKLRDYMELADSGPRDEWDLRKIGIYAPGARRDYANAVGIYDYAGMETCISLIAEYDLKVRSAVGYPKYILMDEFLYKIHGAAGRN